MTLPFRAPRRRLPLAALLALAGPLLAGAALAQPYGQSAPYGGGYGGPYGAPPGQPPGQAPGQPPGQSYGGDAQSEIANLHAALRLTAGQEAAWRTFVAASQPDAQQQARQRSAQQMLPGLTAPQRVDLSLAAMEADLDTLRERGRALKAFYAQLTPAQQKVFDHETVPREETQGGY